MADASARPIIIIRKKGGGHGDGHGNTAWKIAYADFVTAMMAFFLLLWLLNSVTEEQMVGISNYFAPTTVSYSKSGAGGVLGGTDMMQDGAMQDSQAAVGLQAGAMSNTADPSQTEAGDEDAYADGLGEAEVPAEGNEADPGNAEHQAADVASQAAQQEAQEAAQQAQALAAAHAADEKRLEEAKAKLEKALAANGDLKELSQHVVMDMTDEGLRIQIVDMDKKSMFTSGSAQLTNDAARILRQVAAAIATLPNDLAISGHTDAQPYATSTAYGNWELSSDRANASRRALIALGVPESRVREVAGKADTEPFDPVDPLAPVNRRITIVLKWEEPVLADPAVAGPATAEDTAAAEAGAGP